MTRTLRRASVILLYAGYAAILLLAASTHSTRPNPVVIILGGVAVAGLVGVVLARRRLFVAPAGLDERQRIVRDRAYNVAYRVLGLVVVFIATGSILADLFESTIPLAGPVCLVIAGGLILLSFTLPSAIMAWTEPDPPEDSGAYQQIKRSSL